MTKLGLQHQDLLDALRDLFLPVSVLSDAHSTKLFFDQIRVSDVTDGTNHLQSLALGFEAYVRAIHAAQYDAFQQPSSSKVPYEVYTADRVRQAIHIRLKDAIDTFSACSGDENRESALRAELFCWRAVYEYGTFIEKDQHWRDIVSSASKKHQASLFESPNNGKRRKRMRGETNLRLDILVVLERLSHDSTSLTPHTFSICIMVSAERYRGMFAKTATGRSVSGNRCRRASDVGHAISFYDKYLRRFHQSAIR